MLTLFQCHIGILGGGHYVAYARNPNKKWYCYNDSSCKVCILVNMSLSSYQLVGRTVSCMTRT